jgi:tetratricopeptide (TPR) repeat protein
MSSNGLRRSTDPLKGLPKAKWWGKYVADEGPGGRRLVVFWRRIFSVVGVLLLAAYLSCVTLLWGYYSVSRGVPGVHWADIAMPWRFSRVESALASFHFADAKRLWEKKEYGPSILSARSAVAEDPRNLKARLFLADCWRQAGRFQEAVRVLRTGIEVNANDPRLQGAVVQTCLDTGQFEDLLKVLRQDFPAHGVRLLDGPAGPFQLAEVKAVLEVSGAAAAEAVAKRHAGLNEIPMAAPLLAQIDWELGFKDLALDRLRRARGREPGDSKIQDAFVETLLRMGRSEDARDAARQFFESFPLLASSQLRMLEAFDSRNGRDNRIWSAKCIRFLEQFRHDPVALGQLASLAASKGWTDLTFLLYQDSLQENLTGFPFAIYYVSSLLKAGDMAGADEVWHELSSHNTAQLVPASYIAAMIAWGNGRKSDAAPIIDQIRGQTARDLHRRRMIEDVFRSFGFPEIADQLAKP